MQRAQAGEQHAYRELLAACAGMIRAFAMVRVADPDAAEDITQETLLSMHRARHTFDPARPFLPWMYAIARHRLIDNRRLRRRILEHETSDEGILASYPTAEGHKQNEPDSLGSDVVAATEELPARQREVVTRLKLRDQSVKDVAARLSMSESAVKVTAHRAYAALRRRFGAVKDED